MGRAERQSCAGGGLWGSSLYPEVFSPSTLLALKLPSRRAGGKSLLPVATGVPLWWEWGLLFSISQLSRETLPQGWWWSAAVGVHCVLNRKQPVPDIPRGLAGVPGLRRASRMGRSPCPPGLCVSFLLPDLYGHGISCQLGPRCGELWCVLVPDPLGIWGTLVPGGGEVAGEDAGLFSITARVCVPKGLRFGVDFIFFFATVSQNLSACC